MYAWKCMSMWHAIVIASWAQPNPILPAHNQFNIYKTHLNAWKYSYNAHEMQCMKFLRSNLQNPFQKVCKNLINFKKVPNIFQKPPIFRLKDMKMHENEGLRHLPSERNLIKAEESLRKRFGVRERERGFGRWKFWRD